MRLGTWITIGIMGYKLFSWLGDRAGRIEAVSGAKAAVAVFQKLWALEPDTELVAKTVFAAKAHKVPVTLALALVYSESRFDPNAFRPEPGSYAKTLAAQERWKVYTEEEWGSYGLTQMMPHAAVVEGHPFGPQHLQQLLDPEVSLSLGFKHLARYYSRYGSWFLALVAYNAGSGIASNLLDAAGKQVRDQGPGTDYARRILGASAQIKDESERSPQQSRSA